MDQAWVTQQARQLVWQLRNESSCAGFLIHDRDSKYSASFDQVLVTEGIAIVRTPFRAPKANAVAERWVRMVHQECLDPIIVLNEAHLRRVLNEFVLYYNTARLHQGLHRRLHIPPPPVQSGAPVQCRNRLGGILREYFREAAQDFSLQMYFSRHTGYRCRRQ